MLVHVRCLRLTHCEMNVALAVGHLKRSVAIEPMRGAQTSLFDARGNDAAAFGLARCILAGINAPGVCDSYEEDDRRG